MNWGHFLFGFAGRINRAKYWLWVLLYFIAAIIIAAVVYAAHASNALLIGGIIQVGFSIAAFVSSLAVMTKRLHDRHKSAWWLLVFMLVPSVLLGIGVGMTIHGRLAGAGGDMSGMERIGGVIFSLAAAALLIWAFVELGCLRGTIGPNRFGADPLEERV